MKTLNEFLNESVDIEMLEVQADTFISQKIFKKTIIDSLKKNDIKFDGINFWFEKYSYGNKFEYLCQFRTTEANVFSMTAAGGGVPSVKGKATFNISLTVDELNNCSINYSYRDQGGLNIYRKIDLKQNNESYNVRQIRALVQTLISAVS